MTRSAAMNKRKREVAVPEPRKLLKRQLARIHSTNNSRQPLLGSSYSKVCNLREFLLSRLPFTSRSRRKRITSFGIDRPEYARFLDETIVGVLQEPSAHVQQTRKQDLVTFTQTQNTVYGHSGKLGRCNTEEIIGFVIWHLFQREVTSQRPDHILCYGYQRGKTSRDDDGKPQQLVLPGISKQALNANVDALLTSPWIDLFDLLGEDGSKIVSSLLLDCGIFQSLSSGNDNLYQLSGKPLFRLSKSDDRPMLGNQAVKAYDTGKGTDGTTGIPSKSSSISIVRNRMFYARPSINARGDVALGLKHIHVFNRYDQLAEPSHDLQVMRYMFPRQFGLHNVFTSKVDRTETVQPRKDYTLREYEINNNKGKKIKRVPQRLQSSVMTLVRTIRKNHKNCSYSQLLRYYCLVQYTAQTTMHPSCNNTSSSHLSASLLTQVSARYDDYPVPTSRNVQESPSSSYLPYATPAFQVSRFCQAVLKHLLPRHVFGSGNDGANNWRQFVTNIDTFINMRRYETMDLHEIVQNMKLKCIAWLRPLRSNVDSKMSMTDRNKRLELLLEFLYFIFDSVLIPLIRSNFYVTESGVHRNRLLYFRHDIWKKLSEPSLMTLRVSMFKPLNSRQLRHAFEVNKLGYSQVRLLPKESGSRPITNLKRKPIKTVNGRRILGKSINAQLTPVFSVLNLEYQRNPHKLASALFSLGDIRNKLKSFQASIRPASQVEKFFFVKVDIKSCFDTIPQQELIALIDTIMLEEEYRTSGSVEVKAIARFGDVSKSRLTTRFRPHAQVMTSDSTFSAEIANKAAVHKRRTIFLGVEQERTWRLEEIRKLLKEHIQQNIVRIGRKHFRQANGIPQGSVLSSLLCNFFYAEFERTHLAFLDPRSSLLLRLIDDFLLITTDEEEAKSFTKVMSQGHADYGITTNPDKSLANFEVTVSGRQIPRLHGTLQFPYCGLGVDMRTLELSKDRQPKDKYMENALTVTLHGKEGKMFLRKVVSALKLQLQVMLLDSALNQRLQIMATLFESFVETAMKMHRYRNKMPQAKRPKTSLIVTVCRHLVSLANRVLHREQSGNRAIITRDQICWLASTAIADVLSRKQSEYRDVLQWLLELQASSQHSMGMSVKVLDGISRNGMARFQDYVY